MVTLKYIRSNIAETYLGSRLASQGLPRQHAIHGFGYMSIPIYQAHWYTQLNTTTYDRGR